MRKTKNQRAVDFAAKKFAQIFGLDATGKDLLSALLWRVYLSGKVDGIDACKPMKKT